MLKKKLLLVTIILFLSSCGYTPMWKGINSNDVNFTIQIVESKGNDNLNRLINANLKKYRISENEKNFLISVQSKFNKIPISKDKTGKILENNINITVNFKLNLGGEEKIFSYQETTYLKTSDNMIDEKTQERNFIQNLTSTICEKFISELVRYSDT